MSTYTVTKVRKETANDGSHRHLKGVVTNDGNHFTRREVVDSIDQGNTWRTYGGGAYATIRKMS